MTNFKDDAPIPYDFRNANGAGELSDLIKEVFPKLLAMNNLQLMVSYKYEQVGNTKIYSGYKTFSLRTLEK